MSFARLGKALIRRKRIDSDVISETKLDRCLNTLDLTALGIGSTLGLGIYVLAGQVASTKAGPSVIISFAIAAVASVFAGLCYAEFGARVPRAGSAYIYSYVTVGEFMAFVIGWNLVLEYVIGTASVARGYSGYIDSLVNGTIERHLKEWMPMNIYGMSEYPDFLAFSITLLLTVMLATGVKESTRFNTVFTCLNLLVVVYVVVAGAFKVDFHNWNLDKEKDHIPKGGGKGGFMPFGFSGMMAGAATCFYGFIGFDVIATTGEEVKNPQKAIPISIVFSLLFIFLAYFGVSAIQTLMWPYWDQNNSAPLPYVFAMVGWPVAKWIISIGALCGLSTSLLGAMFPLPRVLYAMATDGLIFRTLAEIHPRYKTPLLATFLSGLFAGAMAAMFNVKELADMMSIGTLLAYTLVAVSVLILRFGLEADSIGVSVATPESPEPLRCEANETEFQEENLRSLVTEDYSVNPASSVSMSPSDTEETRNTLRQYLNQTFYPGNLPTPTPLSSRLSIYLVISIAAVLIVLDSFLVYFEDDLFHFAVFPMVLVGVTFVVLVATVVALGRQPRSARRISFQVPWVPLVPVLSMMVNFYLMLKLSGMTWIRFGVWMFFGLIMYIFYGIKHSSGHLLESEKRQRLLRSIEYKGEVGDEASSSGAPLLT